MKANPKAVWERKLGPVLRDKSDSLSGTFKNLLLLAKSRRQLAKLHESLPAHCCLSRELFRELELVWKHIQANPEAAQAWLLTVRERSSGLQKYYLELLNENREWFPYEHDGSTTIIEKKSFRIKFKGFDEEFFVRFLFRKKGEYYMVVIVDFLTEANTHFLLTLPYSLKKGSYGGEASFVFKIRKLRLDRFIGDAYDDSGWTCPDVVKYEIKNQGYTGFHYKKMKPGFIELITEELRKIGVETEDIS